MNKEAFAAACKAQYDDLGPVVREHTKALFGDCIRRTEGIEGGGRADFVMFLGRGRVLDLLAGLTAWEFFMHGIGDTGKRGEIMRLRAFLRHMLAVSDTIIKYGLSDADLSRIGDEKGGDLGGDDLLGG